MDKAILPIQPTPIAVRYTEGAVIQIQPVPVDTMVGRLRGITAITRVWADGDEMRCRLCPNCQASSIGVCTVLTKEKVPLGGGALYRFPGRLDLGGAASDKACAAGGP